MSDRTLVWIDAREAVIVGLRGDEVRVERVDSDVPAHHRATGHVRHDPAVRHGGGRSQTAGESHRLEHLGRFVEAIAGRVPPDDDVLILGPGSVRERLERLVREAGESHQPFRAITCEASSRLTDRQLVARLRRFARVEPRRQTVGAYRWSEPASVRASGQVRALPRRVLDKPPRRLPRNEP